MGPTDRPTRVRYGVLALLCGLTFVLYLDRTCIGKAAPSMQRELGLSDREMGFVFASFTIAYGLFEVITGHWGDRFGSRSVLTRIVLWWSVFTALTGIANGFFTLLLVRFLFGAGEAGALPNAARVTETWFGPERRGTVRGAVTTATMIGAVAAPPVSAYLIKYLGWRWVFGIYALLGVVWAALFWRWFRDRPADHPGVNAAELALIGPSPPRPEHAEIPWGPLFANPNSWLLGGAQIAGAGTVYALFSWYPSYLETYHGLSNETSGWLSGLVMLGGVFGCLAGGWAADWAGRIWQGTRWTRGLVGGTAFAFAAACMLGGAAATDPVVMSCCFSLACLGIHAHGAPFWGAAADVGGPNLAALFGVVNSFGVIGAAASQILFGFLPHQWWDTGFAGCGALLAGGALCWMLVDPRRRLTSLEAASPESYAAREPSNSTEDGAG